MKRTMMTLWLLGAALGLMAQKPLTDFLNVPGRIKSYYSWRDEVNLEKNTECLLQYVTKTKKYDGTGGALQAVLHANGSMFYIPLDMLGEYFEPHAGDKDRVWLLAQLPRYDEYGKGDALAALRQEQSLEADRYVSELEKARLFYDDAALEDYLQCLVLDLMPTKQLYERKAEVPVVRLLKSAAPDMMMLGNGTLIVSTGMLAVLDTEAELEALLAREVAHHLLDHALITVKQNIARANRAAFWGAVADGVIVATEAVLAERYDYYEPGLLLITNDIVQSVVNEGIMNRMGMDYAPKLEDEADRWAMLYMQWTRDAKDALPSALHKMNTYYQRENDYTTLAKYGAHGTLRKRLAKMGEPSALPADRAYLRRTARVVSFEAAMQDYNQRYSNARRLAAKNIGNNLACADDYLMVARSIMKQSNTPESNAECLSYLDKAELVATADNVNITKMRILLMIREDRTVNTVALLTKYQQQLDAMFQQPHTEEDAEWMTGERLWADKLLQQMHLR